MIKNEIIDYREYVNAIRRHLWSIVSFTLVATLLTAYLLQFVTNIYEANTSIFIETKESNVVSIEGMYQVDMSENEYFNTQMSMLKSRRLAEQVYDTLQLSKHPVFISNKSKTKVFILNLAASFPEPIKKFLQNKINDSSVAIVEIPQMKKQRVVLQLLEDLKVSQVERSNLIRVSYKTQAKDLVAQVPNQLSEFFIQGGLNDKSKDNQHALEQLAERVISLKETLVTSEAKLNEYKNNNNLLDLGGVTTLEAQNIEVITIELLNARKQRTDIQIIYSQIKDIRKPTIKKYEFIPWLMENSSILNARRDTATTLSELTELSKLYGVKHPRIKSALSKYKKARLNYAELLKSAISVIKNKYKAAVLNENGLKEDLRKIKNNIRKINNKSYQLRILEKEVEANQTLYETFSTRYKEASETSNLDAAQATIVDRARVPNEAVFPKRILFTFIAFVLSLFFAMLVAWVSESMVKTFRFPEDIKKYLDTAFLGILPKFSIKAKHNHLAVLPYVEDKRSLYAESIRTIRTGIMLSLINEEKKIIIITSSIPSEGKTTASLNIAIAMGKTHKVLIIDTDMRKSSIAKRCGIETNIGLSTLLTQRSELDESIHHFEEWNIDVLPGGEVSNHPQELLCSNKFSLILDQLSHNYDFIFIDSAPIAPVADTLLLTNIVKNIVFVVKSDFTTHTMARSSIDKLKAIDANFIGIILNELDVKKASKYRTDDYYGGYYDDYGYNK